MEANPLANLNDIITTPLAGYWPLSTAATLLVAVGISALCALLIVGIRRWRRLAPVRAAQSELQQLPDRVEITDFNALIKRCALAYYPRRDIAALSGKEWDLWLSHHQNREQQLSWQGLSARQYSPDSTVNKEEYLPLIHQTLSSLGKGKVPC
ncbi:DUF4381 domain-containing protein [Ferrimonas futtsuensis]|uniref:DUF4381 domain-containing protein n=1 Tax=Ferrimonas futtsuensis TaxID=364764 RepID=UPI0004156455|nr:DUF4381 domain-containing protein [Ferrimonas futtsuensis]